jgi:hypothetical protein
MNIQNWQDPRVKSALEGLNDADDEATASEEPNATAPTRNVAFGSRSQKPPPTVDASDGARPIARLTKNPNINVHATIARRRQRKPAMTDLQAFADQSTPSTTTATSNSLAVPTTTSQPIAIDNQKAAALLCTSPNSSARPPVPPRSPTSGTSPVATSPAATYYFDCNTQSTMNFGDDLQQDHLIARKSSFRGDSALANESGIPAEQLLIYALEGDIDIVQEYLATMDFSDCLSFDEELQRFTDQKLEVDIAYDVYDS